MRTMNILRAKGGSFIEIKQPFLVNFITFASNISSRWIWNYNCWMDISDNLKICGTLFCNNISDNICNISEANVEQSINGKMCSKS